MRYLALGEVLDLHRQLLEQTGGAPGLRDLKGLESAIAQPRITFAGKELYPTLEEKAAALCFSLIQNHPFSDGNKRVGHAATEVFLFLNGYDIRASVDEQEALILGVASGSLKREDLVTWLRSHLVPVSQQG